MARLPNHHPPVVIAVLMLLAVIARGDVCHSNRPIVNNGFRVTCAKSLASGRVNVEVLCKTTDVDSWLDFPPEKLNLTADNEASVIFEDCLFSESLNLINVTTSLGLNRVTGLIFKRSSATLSKENLRAFRVKQLYLLDNNYEELPEDLLHEISFKEIEIERIGMASIPDGFFKNATELRDLRIVNSNLVRLKQDDFAALKDLTDLYLFGNKLEDIELGTFDNLINLRLLELSLNKIKTLHSNIFKKLSSLEKINLTGNEFTSLPSHLLQIENSKLWKFRLNSNNGRLTLPNGFFQNMSSLTYVELINNGFTSLPADLFIGTTALKSLNLTRNELETLPPKLFESTSRLNELRLQVNRLQSLPNGIFEYANLESLYLDSNNLTTLTSDILNGLSNLKVLSASYNRLEYIDHQAGKYINKVEYVDLSHNELNLEHPTIYGHSVLVNCINIKELDVSYNNISKMFFDWGYSAYLKKLDVEGNQINHVTVKNFDRLPGELTLNLRRNNISTVDFSGLEESVAEYKKSNPDIDKNLRVLLEYNPLVCDCKLIEFFRYLRRKLNDDVYSYIKIEIGHPKCTSPPLFENVSFSDIYLGDLKCSSQSNLTNEACNELCTCWDFPVRNALSVDCSFRNLTILPEYVGNSNNRSIELNMTGNLLLETPSMLKRHSYLSNVTVLDLSSNNISLVTVDVFSPSLRVLKLHNNSLSRLDSKVLKYLSEDTSLRDITLHLNKWICDCKAREFLSVVQKKLTIFRLQQVMCYPTKRPFSVMTVNELCKDTVLLIVSISSVLAFFGLVIGSLVALYYRYQKQIKIWLYSKQWCLWFVTEDELDKDKQYDAFISFSHKDEDFVIKEIVPKLEDGPRPYKLCLHYRDWLAGEWIPAQIARSVEESRRTIVVLSPNFLESVWGRMEFRTAHSRALSEGRARVIVILYGDIGSTEDLDPELKAYLSMNTYVKWGDPWFWDKLRYALPHRTYEASRRKTGNISIVENYITQQPVRKPENIPLPSFISPSFGKHEENCRTVGSC